MSIYQDKREMEKDSEPKCDGRWNGYYIKASQEAYDKLVELGYKMPFSYNGATTHISIVNNLACKVSFKYGKDNYKPFYLVSGEFTETKEQGKEYIELHGGLDLNDLPTLVIETRQINRAEDKVEIISIADEGGKVYEFEKPEFECELLAIDDSNQIVGLTYPNGQKTLTCFNLQGEAFEIVDELIRWHNKDLAPIKPKWYEDETNFPALVVNKSGDYQKVVKLEDNVMIFSCGQLHIDRFNSEWRLATKEEALSLYYEGK